MVMLESLLDDVQATNDRLGRSMDEFQANLTAFRDWVRTAGDPYPTTTSAVSTDERHLRPGPARRGPV
jgi:hypothetical protein